MLTGILEEAKSMGRAVRLRAKGGPLAFVKRRGS
jgi:hypothetical protein